MNPRSLAKHVATGFSKFRALAASHLDRETVARLYLRGDGLEIGALNAPLQVPPSARVHYVDRLPVNELRRHYPEFTKLPLAPVEIVEDGESLVAVADGSQDFLIANHFLEHCQNPILTLQHHIRVLRPSGILYLTIPDRRFNFDARRPNTELAHFWRDYREGPAWSQIEHFREWVELVEGIQTPVATRDQRITELEQMNYSIHYHVWDHWSFVQFLASVAHDLPLGFDLELSVKHRAEIINILRKT